MERFGSEATVNKGEFSFLSHLICVFTLCSLGLDGRKGRTCAEPRACRLWELVGHLPRGGTFKGCMAAPRTTWLPVTPWVGRTFSLATALGWPASLGNISLYRNRA